MISASLDNTDVPAYVVDFIIYHELLHKKHGICWANGRGYVHTPEFQKEERQFGQYIDAEAVLRKLAGI